MFEDVDLQWMRLALEQAALAEAQGEVPVGAVLVQDGQMLAVAANAPISLYDPSAHAEINVLRQAAHKLQNYRLPGTTLYVTLEPCMMCAGAMVHARVSRVVFAASDPKTGVVSSCDHLLDKSYHNHKIKYQGGLMAEESSQLLKAFFKKRR